MSRRARDESVDDLASHDPDPEHLQLALDRVEVLLQTLLPIRRLILPQTVGLVVELLVLRVWDVSDVEAEPGFPTTILSRRPSTLQTCLPCPKMCHRQAMVESPDSPKVHTGIQGPEPTVILAKVISIDSTLEIQMDTANRDRS